MSEEPLLLNPGPVPYSDAVRRAMDAPSISHRSAEFEAIYERVASGLDYVFGHSSLDGSRSATGGEVLVLGGTGTMGMEAAVANLVEPDSELVAVVNGKFGRRFARIADRHCRVRRVEFDWGESIDPDAVASVVDADTDVVTMAHNETSTGLLNPAGAIGDIARENGAFFLVDGVSSIGGDEFLVDDWNVDVAVTDAQKALAAAPGIGPLYASGRAVEAFDGESAPFYEDLDWYVESAEQNETPFTSAVPLFRAMAVAVEEIEAEGMPERIERHRRRAAAVRDGVRAMGLSMFADPTGETTYSNTMSAIALPEDVNAGEFHAAVRERGVSVASGHAHIEDRIFRVSNMGHLSDDDLARGLRVAAEALGDVGFDADPEAAVEAVRDGLAG